MWTTHSNKSSVQIRTLSGHTAIFPVGHICPQLTAMPRKAKTPSTHEGECNNVLESSPTTSDVLTAEELLGSRLSLLTLPLSHNATKEPLPSVLAKLSVWALNLAIHATYYGPILSMSTDAHRTYTCVCGQYANLQTNEDTKLCNRIDHVYSCHPDWPHVVSARFAELFGHEAPSKLAMAARQVGYTLTGNVRQDESAVAFIVFSRLLLPFLMIKNEMYRPTSIYSMPHSAKAVTSAGATLADRVRKFTARRLPNAFGIVLDRSVVPCNGFIGVYSVFSNNDKAEYAFLGLRPLVSSKPVLYSELDTNWPHGPKACPIVPGSAGFIPLFSSILSAWFEDGKFFHDIYLLRA